MWGETREVHGNPLKRKKRPAAVAYSSGNNHIENKNRLFDIPATCLPTPNPWWRLLRWQTVRLLGLTYGQCGCFPSGIRLIRQTTQNMWCHPAQNVELDFVVQKLLYVQYMDDMYIYIFVYSVELICINIYYIHIHITYMSLNLHWHIPLCYFPLWHSN